MIGKREFAIAFIEILNTGYLYRHPAYPLADSSLLTEPAQF
ncbi:hypothetical protein NIES2100_18550 [Calothrix sp. NIES-2100]|nr:hypothetical protein NIES2100_18550 [Calothrix sp. NIES-2100]